jgi:pimeloyl-ACP methyl ester carboxylesterase
MPAATSTPVAAPVVAPQRGKYLQDVAIERNGSALTLPVFTSLPLGTPVQGVTRAVVMIHGTNRNAVDYFDYASAAVPADVLVVAPRFKTSSDAPRSTELLWTSSGWKQGGESTGSRPWHISSFEAADEVVRVLRVAFPDLGVIVVAGHSAGGQFVQRYAATNIDARVHFVVANPSSYLYLGRERPTESGGFAVPSGSGCSSYNHYKYGLQDIAADAPYMAEVGASALTARYRDADVTYLLGALDTDPNAPDLDLTCEAKLQGASRFERGQQFYRHLAMTFGDGVTAQHHLAVVPGVGHDARLMFASGAGRAALPR